MADDKTLVGEPDRRKVAKGERYEVEDFASRHGNSADEARDLIDRFGNDRAVLEREAAKITHH
jgi:hypothetical protein